MMGGFEGHGWGMGLAMGWWWIIGFIVVACVAWLIFRNVNTKNQSYFPENKSALDLLKERYARGEIDKEEFEERKKDLLSTKNKS
jgi:putative membrane protein